MTEEKLHKQIVDFIKLQYPKAIFNTDMSGLKLSKGQAIKAAKLRSNKGFPDIQILEVTSDWNGLFLEVKKETPFKKNGELKKSDHLSSQQEMHSRLRIRGYRCEFVWSLEMAIELINSYMSEVVHKVA